MTHNVMLGFPPTFAALLCAAVLFSTNALAAADPVLREFCDAPLRFVCGSSAEAGIEVRKKRIEEIERRIAADALKKTSREFRDLHLGPAPSEQDLFSVDRVSMRKKVLKFYYSQLREGIRQYLKTHQVPSDQMIHQIKANVRAIIETSAELSLEKRELFSSLIEQTRLVTIAEFASELENSSRDVAILAQACSKKIFTDNAVADERRGERIIVLCPGMLIASIESAKVAGLPQSEYLSGIIATVAHELAHQFDYRDFPRDYEFLANRLERVRSELGVPRLDGYLSEISADYWANETLALFLKGKESSKVRRSVLKLSLEDLCATDDDGIHPSGAFRIERVGSLTFCP